MPCEHAGEDHDRWLVLGPDRAGILLGVVMLITVEGEVLVVGVRWRGA